MSVLFESRGATVTFGGLVAVKDVDIKVQAGEIHGVIGPNGAGKTTFFNAISGLVSLSHGDLLLDGKSFARLPPYRRPALGMRRTFQSVQLIPQFTALENVLTGLHLETRDNPLSWLLSLSGRSAAEEKAQDRVIEMLEELGIADTLFKRPSELTFVEQRFVEIARALISRPRLLMLDEPAAGLSPSEVDQINALLRKLRGDHGMTIMLVEHVLSLVLDVSDAVTVLDKGQVISRGTPKEVSGDPKVQTAYFGDPDDIAPEQNAPERPADRKSSSRGGGSDADRH
ncbi:MAG: ABC transporter ATP-binding protein [Flavobacteriaceae bacterium]